MKNLLLLFTLCALATQAADLAPDPSADIPTSAKRPVVITGKSTLTLPQHHLPDGYTLSVAAASPLVTHPIMGCLDDRGRLFVGDAVGVNWNKAQLDANPPNRVLMLEDTNRDGSFDKSTIFADKMTFPQGACWLDGSLYVGSPPSIWKLTDTDNDGIADRREEIVTGFDYTGNAADIHGPFLHPSGRLYWCHGRKGHDVKQKDGTPVDTSKACGIWSCKPDGSEVAWHSLGCGDNPVEIDFTPEGDIIGVQNLYYNQPRGDTLIHWLYGGIYERADQLQAISHLTRTLETMPVMYNFGHVAVSGCCFWRSFPTKKNEQRTQNFLVTHFNTQRLVRMDLTPDGSTYKAVENEFLKLHNPDIHLTDVMEDADGSLLLIDTGGWFRSGCPSSLMAKSDILGAVYRITPKETRSLALRKEKPPVRDLKSAIEDLKSSDPQNRRRALEWLAENKEEGDKTGAEVNPLLLSLMSENLDAATEHALIAASRKTYPVSLQELQQAKGPIAIKHRLQCFTSDDVAAGNLALGVTRAHLDSPDVALARECLRYTLDHPDADEWISPDLAEWLTDSKPSANRIKALSGFCSGLISKPEAQKLITSMLAHRSLDVRNAALIVIASQSGNAANPDWIPTIQGMLGSPSPALFDAIKKLKTSAFDSDLQSLAGDSKQPLSIRLKALDSVQKIRLEGATFAMVKAVLSDISASAASRIQASSMLAQAPLSKDQTTELLHLFAVVGPVELKTMLPLLKKHKEPEMARRIAREIAKNPSIASQQESLYRTALADLPVDIFETIILPAYRASESAMEAKKRQLSPLAEKATSSGNAARGAEHFKAGKGSCIACHKVGEIGRAIGPDLSKIGAIRNERDLLESILFPSTTLARDYEAHVIETSDGQQTLGVIKSHTAEGLLVIDTAGQETNLAHSQIIADTPLPTSLMPAGLDQTLPESELLDLIAWLRSLK